MKAVGGFHAEKYWKERLALKYFAIASSIFSKVANLSLMYNITA